MIHHRLDARRLLCPLPVIRVQSRIAELDPGDELWVVFTDPGALHDIPAWSRIHGHRVLESTEGEIESSIVIQVGAG